MQKKKRALTLLEIMIVIVLIALITGVVGYNMKGALDKGRDFRTDRAKEQLRDLLLYRVAERGLDLERIVRDSRLLEEELRATGLTKNVNDLLKDGWGENFEIKLSRDKRDIEVFSKRQKAYKDKTNSRIGKAVDEEDQDE
jgi:prepilin-type N-terminal cleavage/methylation domain-containing protein